MKHDGDQPTIVVKGTSIGNFDYHFTRNLLFWTERSDGRNNRIYSRSLNGRFSGRELIIDQVRDKLGAWDPAAFAVDYIGDKLYVVDNRGRKIDVFELDGRRHSAVVDLLSADAKQIVLDPHSALMFVDQNSQVLKPKILLYRRP